ncbi:MAG: hypothetical protein H7833_02345 [Magnetococcus sp. DMHC-1]|nr:leucine-rich repeat domain-containing protein [Magnetococcales bacterium]
MDSENLLQILDEAFEEQTDILDLSGLDLKELPAEIGRFVHVRRLFLADNRLVTLPPEIASLTALELLDLRRNRLQQLPRQMAALHNLTYLWLGGNGLTELPPVVTALTGLQRLILRHNRLTTLPPEIGALTRLQELSLQDNRLTTLPEEIGQLAALELLFLGGNALTGMPVALRELTALQRLDLSNNQLQDLPVGIHRLTSLIQFDIRQNPLTEIPEALLAVPENVEQIRAWSRQRDATNRLPLREGRLLVAGPPGVGKSVLIRRLREEPPGVVEAPSGVMTVRVWNLPGSRARDDKSARDQDDKSASRDQDDKSAPRDQDDKSASRDQDDKSAPRDQDDKSARDQGDSSIRMNVWELAGSEAARGVYPGMFLPGTMILLVVEDRSGDAGWQVARWLGMMTRPGVEIPVIVACTRADQTLLEPDREAWQQHNPALREIFPQISARTGEGLTRLRQAILRTAQTLESVRALVPEAWQKVRHRIEAEDVPLWTRESLHAVYAEAGISEPHARHNLTEILCRLGLLLPGGEGDHVNPAWGSRVLNRLLDAPSLVRNGGIMPASDLIHLADGVEQTRLLAFLERWECALPLANGNLLVPALLPREVPAAALWEGIPPVCEYHYPLGLPPGLLARLIARLRERVIPGLWWRTGVVLQDADGTAQARVLLNPQGPLGEPSRVVLELRGSGPACRRLLRQCHGVLQEIHRHFPGLPVQCRLVVPGLPAVAAALEPVRLPVAVALEHVRFLAGQGVTSFIPEGCTTTVALGPLLTLANWLENEGAEHD